MWRANWFTAVCFVGVIAPVSQAQQVGAKGGVHRLPSGKLESGRIGAAEETPYIPPTETPFLLRPGHYVYPAPYSPDYWSPHLRPFPDYSHLSRPRNTHRIPSHRINGTSLGFGRFDGGAYPTGGYGYGFSGHAHELEDAYNQGRYDADHEYLWYIASERAGRLLNQYQAFFDEGLLQFRAGNYDRAVVSLIGAARSNQSNAASRLHAGHALFALGKNADAVRQLARAFELSPSLAFKNYDIRDEYGDPREFEAHLLRLKKRVASAPNDASAVTLLGYVSFYSTGPASAYPYLRRAAELDPKSYFIPRLLELSRQTTGDSTSGGQTPSTRNSGSAGRARIHFVNASR